MRIHNLEISNIRGIPYFDHEFRGQNAIILGANGTGKSSILDTIDFLLTGNMSRLQGHGTGGVSLPKHGIHVDMSTQPEKGYVKAFVHLPRHGQPVWIERYMCNPETLECPSGTPTGLDDTVRLARQGQHMLTRRQMLNFITVSPANRAKQIEALLNLELVGDVRKSLVSANGRLKKSRDAANDKLEASQSSVAAIFGLDRYDSTEILRAINDCRHTLGARTLESFSAETVKCDIDLPSSGEKLSVSTTLLTEHASKILQLTSEPQFGIVVKLERDLRKKLSELRRDPMLLRSLSQQQLLELGIDLIDDNSCPLCDRRWNNVDLKAHLEQKIAQASAAGRFLEELQTLERNLRACVYDILSNVEHIISAPDYVSQVLQIEFRHWKGQLESLGTALQDSLKSYPLNDLPTDQVIELLAAESVRAKLERLLRELNELAERDTSVDSPEAVAYTRLAQAESALGQLKRYESSYKLSMRAFNKIVSLNKYFTDSRDHVLNKEYENISDEFVRLYRRLHADEDSFDASLWPKEAALNLDVEFYDGRMYPPNAVHSEGHQDSMGLCLFLVLSRRLSGADLEIMLLDDVVMSVDAGHRKALAQLLKEEFSDRQSIVTTHDRTWTEQLQKAMFVSKASETLEILSWNIQSGIVTREYAGVWTKIATDLATNDVNAAAGKLRWWAESFFRHVCDSLEAPVRFRFDGQLPLSDFYDPARGKFRNLLKKAKNVAQKAKDISSFERIQALDGRRREINATIDSEKWMINIAVHYNSWENLTVEEFNDVVRALRELSDIFHCANCSCLLRVTKAEDYITCGCSETHWPLKNP